MRKRAWRIGTGMTVAVAAGILTMVVGSSQAVANPASIDVAQGPVAAIASDAKVQTTTAAYTMADPTVTAFHGFSTFKGIKIESRGVDIDGTITGKLRSYNFESLWKVYNLPSSAKWSVWVASFKKDTSQSVLKETFRKEELQDINVNMHFRVRAEALKDVAYLRIGFETLRLVLDGQTKDFTVVNAGSGGAKDQNGNDIPVDFQPV